MRVVVAAMHRIARDYAERKGWQPKSYQTYTGEGIYRLKGLPANADVHVVDSGVAFQNSAELEHILESRFTNVTRDHT